MFDAYEVAIMLKLKDQFSGAMGIVTRHLIEGNKHADQLQKRLDNIGKLFSAGVMTTGAGLGIAMVLKASTNEAVKYEQQLNRLKALNLDNRFGSGTTASLAAQAQNIAANTKGTTATEALNLVTETQSITGSLEHTAKLAPLLGKLRFGLETYMSANGKGEGHGGAAEKQFQDIVKVMEMRGLMRNFSDEKMEKMADLFAKSFVASGGMVKPSDFLNMMKTGGTATKSIGDDFMFAMGHIMQEKGGGRSGTALMSEYQNLVAGRMPQQIAETLNKLGLLQAGSIHYGKTGHITKVDAGGMVDSALLQSRPDLYMQKYILPALAKSGVDMTDQNAVLMKLNGLAGQRTAGDLLAQMFLEQSQIANYVDQAKNAMGYKQLYDQGAGSTTGQQNDLRAKINQLELEFGNAALPILKTALEQAVPLVKQFGEWLGKNPEGLKTLVYSIAGLSVAMMVSGPLMMLGSGLGLLSTALSLTAGPLGSVALAMAFRGIGGATGLASIAGNLSGVVGQLKLLGAAGMLFASYELGHAAGTYINDHAIQGTAAGNKIGKWMAMWAAAMGSEEAKVALRKNDPSYHGPGMGNVVAPKAAGSQMINNTIVMPNGQVLASVVTKEQAKNMMMVGNSGAGFDLGLGQPATLLRTF